jgi:Neuraminidase (sialidase)
MGGLTRRDLRMRNCSGLISQRHACDTLIIDSGAMYVGGVQANVTGLILGPGATNLTTLLGAREIFGVCATAGGITVAMGAIVDMNPATLAGITITGATQDVSIVDDSGATQAYTYAQISPTMWTGRNSQTAWSADASLVNAAAQFIPSGALVTQLAQSSGVMQSSPRYVSKLDVAFIGDVANVAGQTATIKIVKSTDNGVTWADLAGATSGALATTAGAKQSKILFTAVLLAEGTLLAAVVTPSALLTQPLTLISVGLRGF